MEMLRKSIQIKTSLYRHLASMIQQTYFQHHTSFLEKAIMLKKVEGIHAVLLYAFPCAYGADTSARRRGFCCCMHRFYMQNA